MSNHDASMEDMVDHENHVNNMANRDVPVEDMCNHDASMEDMVSHEGHVKDMANPDASM